MYIIITILALIALGWLSWLGRRELERRRRKRMSDNAYNTALTLWNFARVVKDHLDEISRGRSEVIDFTNISVPTGTGYNVCLELAGYGFRIHAVPEKYDRTGRVSLYVDNALTVRAWDHRGRNASAQDPEYTGDDLPTETNASQLDSAQPEALIQPDKESIKARHASRPRVIKAERRQPKPKAES